MIYPRNCSCLVFFAAWLGANALFASPQIKVADLKEGDLLFQRSTSRQAALISAATHSPWTHVALALRRKPGAEMSAFESAGPVGFVEINRLLDRSVDGRLIVMRLRDREKILTPDKLEAMRTFLLQQRGKPYNALFLWNDKSMYCSELIWRAYESGCGLELGKITTWSTLDLESKDVQSMLKQRYVDRGRPLDTAKLAQEKIITPAAVFESPLLEEAGVLQK